MSLCKALRLRIGSVICQSLLSAVHIEPLLCFIHRLFVGMEVIVCQTCPYETSGKQFAFLSYAFSLFRRQFEFLIDKGNDFGNACLCIFIISFYYAYSSLLLGNSFTYPQPEAGKTCSEGRDAESYAFHRCIAPWLIVRGEYTQVECLQEIEICLVYHSVCSVKIRWNEQYFHFTVGRIA